MANCQNCFIEDNSIGYKLLYNTVTDINEFCTECGKTVLHLAARFAGSLYHAMSMIESDTDVNIRDNNKHTALYYAAESGWIKAVKILAPRTDYYGLTEALDVAQEYYYAPSNYEARKEIVKLLDDILIKHKEYAPQEVSFYADNLTEAEYLLSKDAIDNLSKLQWCQKLIGKGQSLMKEYDKSKLQKLSSFSEDSLLQLKQTMFEIRFAAAINRTDCVAQNEYKAGMGNTDVDFKVTDTNQQEWLIELTNPRTSDAVKEHTKILKNGIQQYLSTTSPQDNTNSPEVRDIEKTQKAIWSKVANKEGKPIKFPLIREYEAYHIIVVSINSFNNSSSDKWDYQNIVYGSKILTDIEYGAYVRYWYNRKQDKIEMIKGVFDLDHTNSKTKILQARVHAIVFIKENFEENKVKIYLYTNPQFEKIKDVIKNKFTKILRYT
jgi:hypothetical protein